MPRTALRADVLTAIHGAVGNYLIECKVQKDGEF
jgi:hypothetical protein